MSEVFENALTDEMRAYMQIKATYDPARLDSIDASLVQSVTLNVKNFGAKGDGVTDDSQAFLNAISQATSHKNAYMLIPEGTYKITQPLTFYCDIMTIEGYGSTLDFSGMTSGLTAITIQTFDSTPIGDSSNGYHNNIRKGQIHYAKGLYIKGNTNITGIDFNATNSHIAEGFNLEHCAITGFNIGLRFFSNSWCNSIICCSISENTLGVQMPSGGANYAERITFIGSNIHDNTTGMYIDNSNGHFHLIGCSMDYNYVFAQLINGRMYITSSHLESTYDTDYSFKVGNNATLIMKNIEFYMQKSTYEMFDVTGGILDIDGGFFVSGLYSKSSLISATSTGYIRYQHIWGASFNQKPYMQAWVAVSSFLNGWVNYGTPYANLQYYKDENNIVHIRGMVKGGTVGYSNDIFNLPTGYRPSNELSFAISSNDAYGQLNVKTSGGVSLGIGSNTWASIQASFRSEQ